MRSQLDNMLGAQGAGFLGGGLRIPYCDPYRNLSPREPLEYLACDALRVSKTGSPHLLGHICECHVLLVPFVRREPVAYSVAGLISGAEAKTRG